MRTTEDFGFQGDAAHSSRIARLAGPRIRSAELVAEGDAPPDRDQRHVSAIIAGYGRGRWPEIRKTGCWPEARTRLEAELVRDSALQVSGLLSEKTGRPERLSAPAASVTTEGPPGICLDGQHRRDRYRRGLYTFSKRAAPFAMLSTFDGPSGEECVARREVSDTPLQALTLLNDAVFVEVAQALGTDSSPSLSGTTGEDRVRVVPPLSDASAGAARNWNSLISSRRNARTVSPNPEEAAKTAPHSPTKNAP